nr:CI [Callistephus mottle virus]
SLDDIKDTLSNKNQTIDIELDSDERVPTMQISQTFEKWWSNQLARNRTIPHYRTEGYFMEFTRATAVEVANKIHGGTEKDILLRGAVGSGKSTGLPFHLSKRGSVLLLEPTKPLAENVYKQLRGDPFYRNPTLRFRGMNAFGSGSITIMTAGFALHYLANNVSSLKDYDFIIFDECHTIDASGMAFRSLLAEHEYSGKIIKVSATPPGREVEFTTQHPVKLIIEESLSFQQFVQNLGSKANSDVTQYGDNILVYVASYNEVDTLSKLLLDKHYKVTKVDGRTMKSGSMEIVTSGTSSKKHFVVATNIIENGVTLDIEVVVDFGLKVVPQLDIDNRMIRYIKKPISYGERIQRLGRVGRHKPGTALRIGTTEKSLTEIPMIAATEAALMCFAYGLPVMTDNVSPSLVNKCTVQQVRTMLQFELTPFFMVNLVRYDGTMHKAIHDLVKGYKLRDSEVILNKLANPFKQAHMWLTVKDYNKVGCNLTAPDETRIPFHCNDVPDKLYEQVWHAVQEYKADSCIGRVVCVNASKVAYTLQTDIHSLPRTIKILDHLIEEEGIKRAHFNAITENTFSRHNATLSGLINSVRSKYAEDHTARNLEILHAARAQLLEFSNIGDDPFTLSTIEKHPYTSCVYHQ